VGVDVTEREAAEAAEASLRERDSIFRLLAENATDTIARIQLDGTIRYVSPAARTLLGYDPAELVGADGFKNIHEDDLPRLRKAIEQLDASNPRMRYEYRMRRKDGSYAWVETSSQLVPGPEGKDEFLNITRDITQRKDAERALAESEQRYRQIVETAAEGIWIIDVDGYTTFTNPRMAEMLGYEPDELIGLPLHDLVDPANHSLMDLHLQRRREGVTEQHDLRFRRKDGRDLWAVVTATPIVDADANRTGTLAMITDITGRKQAEEALMQSEATLQSVFAAAPIGIGLAKNRVFEWVNDEMARLSGYTKDELAGQSTSMLYDDKAEYERAGRIVYAQVRDKGTGAVDARLRRRNNEILNVMVSLAATDPGDPSSNVVFTVVDFTKRKAAEDELARYRDHLEELVAQRGRELEASTSRLQQAERLASLGNLAAGIAHEINNPVGAILLAADYALQCINDPDGREVANTSLNDIRRDARRCRAVIKTVLQVGRQTPAEMQLGPINPVVQQACEQAGEVCAKMSASLDLVLAENVPPVLLNGPQLVLALSNLLRNAAEAGRGSQVIRVSTEADEDQVRVRIQDQGVGMTEEQRKHIFNPFYTTRQNEGGTGLGLSIAHGIIDDHRGGIDVESRPGAGTTVVVRLPVTKASEGSTHG
jgi:two-component system sensor histidine kinase/response regulator